MSTSRIALIVLAHAMLARCQTPLPSLFVPEEYVSNTFEVSIAGNDATATTYLFSPGCENFACGPVTLVQGPTTAIYSAANVPPGGITTVYSCALSPAGEPTTAECTLKSHWPDHDCCSGSDTKQYPPGTGFAFPTYRAILTAGSITGVETTAAVETTGSVALSSASMSIASSTASSAAEASTTASMESASATSGSSSEARTGTISTPVASSTPSVASETSGGMAPAGATSPSRVVEACVGLVGGLMWL
ncbi:hypothetical protein PMIN04_011348 [Paraphaeosphaeria minitans]